MAKRRTYITDIKSTRVGTALTDATVDAFSSAVMSNLKLAESAPGANLDLGILELRATLEASGPTNALAIAEVAFLRAAQKAGVNAQIAEACVWADKEDSTII